jgi:hypothetical protein
LGNSGKFWPESGEIQFPVPVKLKPEQGFEIPVPVTRTGIVFGQIWFPALKTPSGCTLFLDCPLFS